MEWLIQKNIDGVTQIFVSALLILAIMFVIGANIFYVIKDKRKNKK